MTAITRKQALQGYELVSRQITVGGCVGKVPAETLVTRVDLVVTVPYESPKPPVITVGDEDHPAGFVAEGDVDAAAVGSYRGGLGAVFRTGKYYPEQQRLYVNVEGESLAGACHAVFHCVPLEGLLS